MMRFPAIVDELKMSLEDVNDSLLMIMRFLPAEDLNSFAICSRRCREARNSPLLDQTRTGTIVCSLHSSILEIYNAISRGGWNNELYSGFRTRLRVVGLERVVDMYTSSWDDIHHQQHADYMQQRARSDDVQLTGVTSLDLSHTPHDNNRTVISCEGLALILPNLRELDLSNVLQVPDHLAEVFCNNCPHLTRLTWNGSRVGLFLDGSLGTVRG